MRLLRLADSFRWRPRRRPAVLQREVPADRNSAENLAADSGRRYPEASLGGSSGALSRLPGKRAGGCPHLPPGLVRPGGDDLEEPAADLLPPLRHQEPGPGPTHFARRRLVGLSLGIDFHPGADRKESRGPLQWTGADEALRAVGETGPDERRQQREGGIGAAGRRRLIKPTPATPPPGSPAFRPPRPPPPRGRRRPAA